MKKLALGFSPWKIGTIYLLLTQRHSSSNAFSLQPNDDTENSPLLSRRNLLTWAAGGGGVVIYGKLLSDALTKLSRGDMMYPEAHERREESTITRALVEAIPTASSGLDETRPLRVLEVGIGSDLRVQRRGLYDDGLSQLAKRSVRKVQLTGVDIVTPKPNIMEAATRRMTQTSEERKIDVNVDVVQASISSKLDFPDGYFDCILCFLTLCSVTDQDSALQEIKRLLRPHGGTFGYVEHVAVNADEPYRFLEIQQELFDPLQQLVADNCHLHRFTEDAIANVFETDQKQGSAQRIFQERFIVDDMWPVSCQCCGVIKRSA